MQVTIDGVPYAPVCNSVARIGIAITTHNRADVLCCAIAKHKQFLPSGALVVVIDDGSLPAAVIPDGIQLIRHDKSLGIVASKNRSLEVLMNAGCEHLFLWDDDAWPIAADWHLAYIESPEPHLAYQFLDLAGRNKLNDMAVLYQDSKHIAYTGQRGVMLYYHRSAIEKVGGFDPVYGRGMYEHPDLALRIHNAGLSTWPFADVTGSEQLIHSMDEYEEGMGGGTAIQNYGAHFQFAKGAAFSSASLNAYSNTVVDKPTPFAFAKGAGLMGEAGPEAIMPLTRAPDGSLGVRSTGGGASSGGLIYQPQYNVAFNSSGENGQISPQAVAGLIEMVKNTTVSTLRNEMRNGGLLSGRS
jgi:hypothetical protein